ncbi:DNA polymerase delta subunit 1 [Nematocida minor]|uniref:DNA polymerase delta subunit 1 n=1 Tax=Nematocida minor TaxID=1912983 RepID=UPI00221F64E5|nr:DNA polymerase delta subunit 1 [Nematocida minor]KAI5191424.1 DNA polymerase delta subunit 1 [Nematocida minor]
MHSCSLVFLPLHIHYSNTENGPLVHLQGKTKTGAGVECTLKGFHHYFYISKMKDEEVDENALRKAHKEIDEVKTVTKSNIYGYAEEANEYLQIFIRDPKAMASASAAVRDYFEKADRSKSSSHKKKNRIIFEASVGYIIRFMVDKGIVGMGYVEARNVSEVVRQEQNVIKLEVNHNAIFPIQNIPRLPPIKILSLDIECIGEGNRFPSPLIDPVVQIGNAISIYPNPAIVEKVLFCTKTINPIPGVTVFTFEDEREMLMGWSQWVASTNPDVLTGYNITQFDMPYLLNRANALSLEKFKYFSRTGEAVHCSQPAAQNRNQNKTPENSQNSSKGSGNGSTSTFTAPTTLSVPGRMVFDMLDIIKKEFNLHSYSLNAVSAHFLGEQKEDVHYTQIKTLYNGTDETRKRLAIYCLKDTYLPMRLLFTKNLFINYCELARVTGVPFDYLVNRGQGIRVMSQLLRQAKTLNYILPNVQGQEETYEGGYVMEPERGFYSSPVVVLDYASLYPSIIMAYNLCYTTLLSKEQALKMEKNEYIESPTGDYFIRNEVKPGILPVILTNLLQGRKAVREELKNTKDPELKASLNARQLALKVSANSVYGFTGAAKTGLACIPISRSVTGFGREILKKTKELVEGEYNEEINKSGFQGSEKWKLLVAYGDTDSVMVTQPGITLEQAFEIGNSISLFVSNRLPNPLTLEFEKVYHPFVLMNKKRYAGCAKSSANDPGRIDTKGIETVRRDNCLLIRELMKECIDKVLLEGDVEGTRKLIRERVDDLLKNNIGISQLIITKSISKQEGEYAVTLAHVSLAERMRKREGTGPGLGDRVPYVIIAGKGPLHERSEDPVYALQNNLPIDTLYYLKNQITKPLERLLSYVIKDINELLSPPPGYTGCMGGENGRREMPKGIGSFFKKKKVCGICRSGEYPVCKVCTRAYPEVIMRTYKKLYELQYKYYKVMGECQDMQESRHTPIVCSNRDCPVYYVRIELVKKIEEVQERYNQLLEYKKKI